MQVMACAGQLRLLRCAYTGSVSRILAHRPLARSRCRSRFPRCSPMESVNPWARKRRHWLGLWCTSRVMRSRSLTAAAAGGPPGVKPRRWMPYRPNLPTYEPSSGISQPVNGLRDAWADATEVKRHETIKAARAAAIRCCMELSYHRP